MTKGQRIRFRREELNIGQTELAEKINVSKQTLYKYETDIVTNIPSDKVEALAHALDTTPQYIMGWDENDVIVDLKSSPEEMEKAFRLWAEYENLPPDKQTEFLNFLKFLQSNS